MRRSTHALVTGSAAVGLAVSALVSQPLVASAEPECLAGSSDFDQDGLADVIVGAPGGSGRAGAVQVQVSNEGEPITVTITGKSGFGSAVTTLSSYVDQGDDALCSQLVVGSPEESSGTGKSASGAVYLYAWDGSSERFALSGVFRPGSRGVEGEDQAGARFGATLAAEQRAADVSDPEPRRLWVGAPGFDVEGARDVGRLTSFRIDDAEEQQAHETQTIDYGADFTPGFPSAGAALGSSLSVGGGLVAAGAPGHTVGSVAGAGAVIIAPSDRGPDDFITEELSQATKGVPGAPEKGDRFGSSVHLVANGLQPPTLLVGAPGEDLGQTADAGAVTIARISATTGEPTGTVRAVDQDSPGMAGGVEAGDGFGSAVSSIRYGDRLSFLIGTPGEDVGTVRDAGMVQTVGDDAGWTQNTRGVPGNAEAGDRMGASLGGAPSSGATRPLIAVPGEDTATGSVIVGLPLGGLAVDYLKGTRAGDRYGFAVSP